MDIFIMYTLSLCFIFLNELLIFSNAINTNTTSTIFLKDPNYILSNNNLFKLGFFSPPNSSRRYVGIWYKKINPSKEGVVWVANRNASIDDNNGTLEISENGNFVIFNGKKDVIWESNLPTHNNNNGISPNKRNSNYVHAKLLDTGNLVLVNSENNGSFIWQSFDYPTDTVLPNMQITVSTNLASQSVLQSWTSSSNPFVGRYSIGAHLSSLGAQLMMWDGGKPYWRSGPWSGNIFIGMQYNVQGDPTSTGWRAINDTYQISMVYSYPNNSFIANYVVSYLGFIFQKMWDDGINQWKIIYQIPENQCSFYGICGEFGYGDCNNLKHKKPICRCLKGFIPKNIEEWSKGNGTKGCVRRTQLKRILDNSSSISSSSKKTDGFLKMDMMKVPDNGEVTLGYNEDQCGRRCLMNCSCLAYSYYSGIGCMSWGTNLIDMVQLSFGGATLYLRLSSSELENKSMRKMMIIIATIGAAVATTITITIWLFWRKRMQKRVRRHKTLLDMMGDDQSSIKKFEELPLFEINKLESATNAFQDSNKLGEGGFGPVYKGTLEDGQEIAVKRLSRASHQGIEEFKNEVLVISKLQHRNLIKLLGCCVEGQEKMLVYEFMPNKSLDAYLFDDVMKESLDWNKRFCIIEGICRGLLYLHRDSRLKIIHRDLKAANILLDEHFNPKISDFGTARIFRGNQIQDDTRRIVGTYGYMPPEYAMEGQFSEKSDVFSFGVLLLEIISGKKNQWFYQKSLSLLGYAWKMWSEDNILEFIDPVIIVDEDSSEDVSKCIQVGLLCVQENAQERPNISNVISMLKGETSNLVIPKPPGCMRRDNNVAIVENYVSNTINFMSITSTEGR